MCLVIMLHTCTISTSPICSASGVRLSVVPRSAEASRQAASCTARHVCSYERSNRFPSMAQAAVMKTKVPERHSASA